MKPTMITAAVAAYLSMTARAASIQARNNAISASFVPPDLYVSPAPVYAGAPIIMKEPTNDDSLAFSSSSKWAMTYTPYTSAGSCKTAAQVASDIASIASKDFTTIRLYATDCNAIPHVAAAAKTHALRLVLGIYIDEAGTRSGIVDEQIRTISEWAASSPSNWDIVDLIVAGNEALFNNFATAADLVSLLTHVRHVFGRLGYEGPVTTAEPVPTLSQHADVLCPALDVLAANLHPFFHNDVAADEAGSFATEQLELVAALCAAEDGEEEERTVVALEVGWPKRGSRNKRAVPGEVEQKIAIGAMVKAIGERAAFVSFEDEGWRDPGDFGVEQAWGCADLF